MFRLKFALGFVLLIAAQALVAYILLHSSILPAVLEDSDVALQRSAALIEKSHRIDDFALLEKARYVANRPATRRAISQDYTGDWQRERQSEVFKALDTERIRFEEFMAPRNEGVRNLDLDLMNRRPASHEIFMVLDESGHGVASLNWSEWTGDNVANDFPIVLDAMESNQARLDLWNWSWRGEDRDLYAVAIAPIRHTDREEAAGVVVLGTLINDGLAERSKALISDGLGADGSEALSSRAQILSPEIAFFRGDRIYASTLRSRDQAELTQKLFEEGMLSRDSEELETILDIGLDDREYRAMVRFFTGQFQSDSPAGVILLTNRTDAVAPVARVQNFVLVLAALIGILGLILLGFFFYLFLRPFEKLEDGLQEILSGDKDYVFEPPSKNNELANGLAHQLNMVCAYLQGKPLPDEDAPAGGWDDLGGGGDEDASAPPAKKPAVAGVPMNLGAPAAEPEDNSDGDDDDSIESTEEDDEEEGIF